MILISLVYFEMLLGSIIFGNVKKVRIIFEVDIESVGVYFFDFINILKIVIFVYWILCILIV